MVQLRYAADSKESDWLTREGPVTGAGLGILRFRGAAGGTGSKRLYFKLRGSTLAAHPEVSYPELWRSPVKELKHVRPEECTFVVRLERGTVVLRADDRETFARWLAAIERSAGTSFNKFYKKEKRIGKGHFSDVFIASDRATGDKFAVKVIKKDKNDMEKSKKFIRREVKVLSTTDHPNLVRAVDFFSSSGKPHIVMEYVAGGSLRDLIRKRGYLSEPEARPVVSGVLAGLAYLHERNIVHRDMKPENVLMVREDWPKITDFGLATFLDKEDRNIHSMVGTPSYVAPEVIRNVPYGPPADVWSCGILLYFMLSGERPFIGDTREDIKRAVLAGDLSFPDATWCNASREIRHLICAMLSFEPRTRVSAADALEHPWLASR